jgi:hypothetical protein
MKLSHLNEKHINYNKSLGFKNFPKLKNRSEYKLCKLILLVELKCNKDYILWLTLSFRK